MFGIVRSKEDDERVSSQFQLLDHGLTLKAEEEVVRSQGGHLVPSGIGSAGDVREDDWRMTRE